MCSVQFRLALTLGAVIFSGIIAGCGSSDDSTTATAQPSASSSQGPSSTTLDVSSSQTATPTLTPAPTPPGTDNGICTATASMSNPTPGNPTPTAGTIRSYTQTITGVLSCNGVAPTGAIMHAVWHEKTADKTCDATADATGTASCHRQIGNLREDFTVVIDVTFGLNGAAYRTTTSFTPH